MGKAASIVLLAVTLFLVSCTPASPTAITPSLTVVLAATPTLSPTPTQTPTLEPSPTPTFTPTATPSPTSTPTPTSTATPPILYGLLTRVFHDFNGNGEFDPDLGEYPIEGVVNRAAGHECTSDVGGICDLGYVRAGGYNLEIVDPSARFRYILPSVSEVISIENGLGVVVNGDKQVLVPLGEGFLTLPFGSDVPIVVDANEGDYFDHDPGPDALWWNGVRLGPPRPHTPANVHPETDFKMAVGESLYAAAPGRIHSSNVDGQLNFVGIDFLNGFGATYLHIDKSLVEPGQMVKRGQQIAVSGSSGTPYPHTAFQFYHWDGNRGLCVDPYIPNDDVMNWIHSTNNNGVWVSGTWEWRVYPFEVKWPLIGYWTKANDPQYPP